MHHSQATVISGPAPLHPQPAGTSPPAGDGPCLGPTLMSFLRSALEAVTWSWDLALPLHNVILGTMLNFSKPSNSQL